MDPVANPSAYNKIVLAGKESPGRARLNFPMREEGWDKQEPKGDDGGETVHNGRKIAEFDCELYLWKEKARGIDHFARWDEWKSILLAPVQKNAQKALDIYHPQLDGLNISSVVVNSWCEPQPDGKGGATVKIKFTEYRPHKPAAAKKPSGSTSSDPKREPDPNQDKKDELAALNALDQSL
jgi:hypothetical protein